MPGENIQDWSVTAATNATADTLINWAEGQPRASVNNSARSMMAAHAKDRNLKNGSISTGGTANAQTFTSGLAYTTVPTGLVVRLKIGVTNTGATTLNMDSIGDVAIKDQAGLDIGPNALLLGRYAEFLYNGTNWIMMQIGASAAPFDALASNGIQINGSMEVSQQNGSTSVPAGGYPVDGWQFVSNGVQGGGCTQAGTGGLNGFQNCVQIGPPASANTSPAAADYHLLRQSIEGFRFARLGFGSAGASPVTISFWTKANRTGMYSGSLQNGGATRSYPFTFTINAATTWEFKTVTIPGDTTGTWATGNTTGAILCFAMMCGTNLAGPPGAWVAGNFSAATGTINGVASTSDAMFITGVTILPGTEAPSAARSPLIMRPYDQELITCRRYFQLLQSGLNGVGGSSAVVRCRGTFSPMRASPTVNCFPTTAGIVVDDDATATFAQSSPSVTMSYINADRTSARFEFLNFSGITQFRYYAVTDAGGRVSLDARL